MLKYESEDRFNAAQAYSHKWIQRKTLSTVSAEILKNSLDNMVNFRVYLS